MRLTLMNPFEQRPGGSGDAGSGRLVENSWNPEPRLRFPDEKPSNHVQVLATTPLHEIALVAEISIITALLSRELNTRDPLSLKRRPSNFRIKAIALFSRSVGHVSDSNHWNLVSSSETVYGATLKPCGIDPPLAPLAMGCET
jgi:hypothetical protein